MPGQEKLIEHTIKFLEECANEGLRTLLVAQKEIDLLPILVNSVRN